MPRLAAKAERPLWQHFVTETVAFERKLAEVYCKPREGKTTGSILQQTALRCPRHEESRRGHGPAEGIAVHALQFLGVSVHAQYGGYDAAQSSAFKCCWSSQSV